MLKTAFCKKDHRIIILPPKITAIQGPDNYPSDITINESNFVSIPYGWFHHTHTQYQIATDPEFNNIVVDITTDTDLYSETFSSDLFNSSSKYYVRVRFKDGDKGVTSDWIISSFHTPANNLKFDSYNISTDFIKIVGMNISDGKLEPIAYQDIIDSNYTSTTTEIYIDYNKIELQEGDLLKTDGDEYFQVQSINHDGDVYIITPDHTLDNPPNEVYFIGHRAIAIKEFQDEWSEITNITATEQTQDVIDTNNLSTTHKIYINNQLIDIKPGDVFNADNNELFEVAVVDNDGNVAYASDVRAVACGAYHTVIIKNDGSVWGTGWNGYGELGLGDTNDRNQFTDTGMTAKFVACGKGHTVIIKEDGSVWSTGSNSRGQLGLGDTNNRNQFTDTGMTAKFVACGDGYTVIIKEDGSVWSTGWGRDGQLGLGDSADRNQFTNTGMTAKQVACIFRHTVIIREDGSVWSTGQNNYGQLGLGDTNDRHEFTNTGVTAKLPEGGSGSYYTKYWIIPNNPLSQPPTSVYPVSKFNINGIQLQPNPTYDPETGVQSYTFQDIRLNEPSNVIKLSVDISDVTTVNEISMDLLK